MLSNFNQIFANIRATFTVASINSAAHTEIPRATCPCAHTTTKTSASTWRRIRPRRPYARRHTVRSLVLSHFFQFSFLSLSLDRSLFCSPLFIPFLYIACVSHNTHRHTLLECSPREMIDFRNIRTHFRSKINLL